MTSKTEADERADKHEEAAQSLIADIRNILLDGLRLSEGQHPELFERQRKLVWEFRELLRDEWLRGREHGVDAAEKKMCKAVRKAAGEL